MRWLDLKRFPGERVDAFQVSRPIALASFNQGHRLKSMATFSNATGRKSNGFDKLAAWFRTIYACMSPEWAYVLSYSVYVAGFSRFGA